MILLSDAVVGTPAARVVIPISHPQALTNRWHEVRTEQRRVLNAMITTTIVQCGKRWVVCSGMQLVYTKLNVHRGGTL